jgi:SAM-dependent methyltransferase
MKTDTGAELRAQYDAEGGVTRVFGAKVADYMTSRPGYPAALIDMLVSHCARWASATIADVGAGTGLLTLPLLQAGLRVTAIEPNAEMRQACDQLLGVYSHYRSIDGSAEATQLPAQSVDLITAAQAFHWFDVERARAEFLRVLQPAGQVALIWNDRVRDDVLHVALDEVFAEFGGAKRGALLAHEERHAVPQFFGEGRFAEFSFSNEQQLSRAGLLSLVLSRSYMPARDTQQGQAVAAMVQRVFEAHAHHRETVTVRYRTIALVGRPS